MPHWVQEAVLARFERLMVEAEELKELQIIRVRTNKLKERMEAIHSAFPQHILDEWDSLHAEERSMLSQWFYIKGIQDGLSILIFELRNENLLANSPQ
jgi:hypothetical protein